MIYLSENLLRLRKENGYTQENVADFLNVTPQSISKWERGETYPDITLLPAISNLYKVSTDRLLGMDKINSDLTRKEIFASAHNLSQSGEYKKAADIYREALKIQPNDYGMMSELAINLSLCESPEDLKEAVSLCKKILSSNCSPKIQHTTKAALCYIYLKSDEKDKAFQAATTLPHRRECRETVTEKLNSDLSNEQINGEIKYLLLG